MVDAFSTGWAIFKKSITQIIYNLPDALKISGPLWTLIYLITYAIQQSVSTQTGVPEMRLGLGLLVFLASILVICGFCWVAILWHRFMLLNEGSDNLVTRWKGSRIWSYLKYLLIVGFSVSFIVMIPFMIIMSILGNVLAENPILFLLIGFVVSVLFYYLSLRFGLVLPSVALDIPITMGASYTDTDDSKGAILIASILLVGFTMVVGQLLQITRIDQYTLQLPSFIANWFFAMTGISILTTLYGYVVEKRELV